MFLKVRKYTLFFSLYFSSSKNLRLTITKRVEFMGKKKIYPRQIQVFKCTSFRHMLIKLIKIVNSLIRLSAFWVD